MENTLRLFYCFRCYGFRTQEHWIFRFRHFSSTSKISVHQVSDLNSLIAYIVHCCQRGNFVMPCFIYTLPRCLRLSICLSISYWSVSSSQCLSLWVCLFLPWSVFSSLSISLCLSLLKFEVIGLNIIHNCLET